MEVDFDAAGQEEETNIDKESKGKGKSKDSGSKKRFEVKKVRRKRITDLGENATQLTKILWDHVGHISGMQLLCGRGVCFLLLGNLV